MAKVPDWNPIGANQSYSKLFENLFPNQIRKTVCISFNKKRLKKNPTKSDSFRFIPRHHSEWIRSRNDLNFIRIDCFVKRFVSRLMKNDPKSIWLNPIHCASILDINPNESEVETIWIHSDYWMIYKTFDHPKSVRLNRIHSVSIQDINPNESEVGTIWIHSDW